MNRYVLGFSGDKDHTLLLRKSHPLYQAGKLNGVGGKIESGESPLEAMSREWEEETDSLTPVWEEMPVLDFGAVELHCFCAEISFRQMVHISLSTSDKDEPAMVFSASFLPHDGLVEHVDWLILLSKYFLFGGGITGRVDVI